MKIIINEPLVKRNHRIGKILTYTSLAILAAGLLFTFKGESQIVLAYVALIIGFLMSQIGIYFSSRWGRSPRPYEILTESFKGFDDHFSIYHFKSPVSHLLLGPNGLWILMPYPQKGTFFYEKGKYQNKGSSLYLKLFGQEGFGRPDLEASAQVKDLQNFLAKKMDENEIPPINPILVFTHEDVEVKLEDAPYPGLQADKVKDFVRKRSKEKIMPAEKYNQLAEIFDNYR